MRQSIRPGAAPSAPAGAATYSAVLSPLSGNTGATATYVVTPDSPGWRAGEIITPTVIGGSVSPASLIGNGQAVLTFTITITGAANTNCTVSSSGSSGMTNRSGTAQFTIMAQPVVTPAPTTPTGIANRIDLILGASAVAPGTAVSISVVPNATWPSATGKSITLTPSNGDPAIVLSAPTSGSAALTGSYSPSAAGEVSLTATNTAGLYNPYPAPLTVFAASSGAAQTISASLTRADMVTFQRDVAAGNPAGFSASWAKGWGEVWLTVGQSGAALFMRLYDSRSAGATGSAGTGTALTGIVQVHGAFAAGTVRVLLPAGPYIYYADVATDAAFSNPVRLVQRFRVGVVIGHFSRSQESGLSRSYAYTNNTPLPTTYTKTATWVGFDYRYADTDSGWYMHDGVTADPYQYHYSEASSAGAQEIGRLIESQLGVCVGIAGSSATGGGLDSMVNHDGSLAGGFAGTVAAAIGSKFRYFWMATGGWDGIDSTNYPSETHAEVRTRIIGAVDWIARNFPSCAVIGWCTSASGLFGSDGSRAVGYTRNQMILLNEVEPSNPMVVSKENYNWNEYNASHATMSARVDYIRPGFRKLMAAELAVMGGFQTAARGPTLATSGTYDATARTLTLGYTLPAGAAALQTIGLTYSNPNPVTINGATAQEIAGLFAVYVAGGYQGNGTAIKIDSATISQTAQTITLALTGSSGVTYADGTTGAVPGGFSVQFAADFGVSNGALAPGSGRSAVITDDRVDTANGIPYGWHMLPALDVPVS